MKKEQIVTGCITVIVFIVVMVLLVWGLLSWANSNNSSNSPERQAEIKAERAAEEKRATQYRDESQAREFAEQVISKRLKNPAGAKFSDLKAVSLVKDVWVARGTVDATNSFNAVIRSNFQVVFKIDRSGERPVWEVTSVEMN